jgi:hypothetical protein
VIFGGGSIVRKGMSTYLVLVVVVWSRMMGIIVLVVVVWSRIMGIMVLVVVVCSPDDGHNSA